MPQGSEPRPHLDQVVTTDCVNAHIKAEDLGDNLDHDGIGLVAIPQILNKSVQHRVHLDALFLLKLMEPVARGEGRAASQQRHTATLSAG
jgi:hypothetical protein